MPISAPNPNSSPSTKRDEAFTSTAAASTSLANRSAAAKSPVTITSEWPVPVSLMWSMASPSESTTFTDIFRSRYSVA